MNYRERRVSMKSKKAFIFIVVLIVSAFAFKGISRATRLRSMSDEFAESWNEAAFAVGSTDISEDGEVNFYDDDTELVNGVALCGDGTRNNEQFSNMETKDYFIINENDGDGLLNQNVLFDGPSKNVFLIDKKDFKVTKNEMSNHIPAIISDERSNNVYELLSESEGGKRNLSIIEYKIQESKLEKVSQFNYDINYTDNGENACVYNDEVYLLTPETDNIDNNQFRLVKLEKRDGEYEEILKISGYKSVNALNIADDKVYILAESSETNSKSAKTYFLKYDLTSGKLEKSEAIDDDCYSEIYVDEDMGRAFLLRNPGMTVFKDNHKLTYYDVEKDEITNKRIEKTPTNLKVKGDEIYLLNNDSISVLNREDLSEKYTKELKKTDKNSNLLFVKEV